MKPKVNILVTGSGAPGTKGTLYCLKAGSKYSGSEIEIIGIDKNPQNSSLGFCSRNYAVPNPGDEGYSDRIEEICHKEDIDIILPQTTKEIDWFSNNSFSQSKFKVIVNDGKTIELFNDKIRTAELFRDNDLGCPLFLVPKTIHEFDAACDSLGYPINKVVVKLAVSNGMRGLRILNQNPWDFEKFKNEKPSGVEITKEEMRSILVSSTDWPRIMVSEYLEGAEYSVDCYRGSHGEVAIPRKRDLIRSGISFQTTLENNSTIIEASLRAARLGNLTGVFGFQFKMSRGVPKILECNPRVQGTMVASLLSGNNVIWNAIADQLPDRLSPIPINQNWDGGKCYRYWGAVLGDRDSNVFEVV